MAKAKTRRDPAAGPETVIVVMANAGSTSLGSHEPGDMLQLPGEEGLALVRNGYAHLVTTSDTKKD